MSLGIQHVDVVFTAMSVDYKKHKLYMHKLIVIYYALRLLIGQSHQDVVTSSVCMLNHTVWNVRSECLMNLHTPDSGLTDTYSTRVPPPSYQHVIST